MLEYNFYIGLGKLLMQAIFRTLQGNNWETAIPCHGHKIILSQFSFLWASRGMWANHLSSLFLSFICRMRIARPLLKIAMWCTNENHYIRIRYCCYYYYHLDIIYIAILLEYWAAAFIGHTCCTTKHLALCQINILLSVTVFTIKVKAETYSNERIYAAFMGHCLALIHSTQDRSISLGMTERLPPPELPVFLQAVPKSWWEVSHWEINLPYSKS